MWHKRSLKHTIPIKYASERNDNQRSCYSLRLAHINTHTNTHTQNISLPWILLYEDKQLKLGLLFLDPQYKLLLLLLLLLLLNSPRGSGLLQIIQLTAQFNSSEYKGTSWMWYLSRAAPRVFSEVSRIEKRTECMDDLRECRLEIRGVANAGRECDFNQ